MLGRLEEVGCARRRPVVSTAGGGGESATSGELDREDTDHGGEGESGVGGDVDCRGRGHGWGRAGDEGEGARRGRSVRIGLAAAVEI